MKISDLISENPFFRQFSSMYPFTEEAELNEEIPRRGLTDGAETRRFNVSGHNCLEVIISESASDKYGKPAGIYHSIFVTSKIPASRRNLTHAVEQILKRHISPSLKRILVAGMGNTKIAADSLGVKTARKILSTAQFAHTPDFSKLGLRQVYSVCPGVFGETGVESAEHIGLLAKQLNVGCIVAIDSLSCGGAENIARLVQISDAGIIPGSGVQNRRTAMSRRTLNIPVISIGVPTVADADSSDFAGIVTLRDIDAQVDFFADAISSALNRLLNPNLTAEERETIQHIFTV